jgi:uncharacterized membrane protein
MEYIFTFLWSMAPVCELRCSIPLGMESYHLPWLGTRGYDLPWYGVLPVSVAGNLVPGVFWLLALPWLGKVVTSVPNPVGWLLLWRSEQLRRRNAARFHRYGALALAAFVAVPFPLTGVWTGCLAAWVFELPFWRALLAIALGAAVAGGIVTGLTILGIFVVG